MSKPEGGFEAHVVHSFHGDPTKEVFIEEEEKHEKEVGQEQQQQQLLIEQEDQRLDKHNSQNPPILGQLQLVEQLQEQGRFRLAFVATDRYRKQHSESFHHFLRTQMRWIIHKKQGQPPGKFEENPNDDKDFDSDFGVEFEVIATGRTYDALLEFYSGLVAKDAMSTKEFEAISRRVHCLHKQTHGIVQVTFELVEGRLGCVFHLCDYKDINTSQASAVLRRQSLVHNVPYTDSLHGAEAIALSWWRSFEGDSRPLIVKQREGVSPCISSGYPYTAQIKLPRNPAPPLSSRKGNRVDMKDLEKNSRTSEHRIRAGGTGRTDYNNNIALIAHDGKKLELCCLALENIQKLLRFDRILCTGTTGSWLKRYFTATLGAIEDATAGDKTPYQVDLNKKLVICESGPMGGDVQIAFAALSGYCSRVIFLIDPMEAHPHEVDIRFFEQAVESSEKYPVHVATNQESALYLLSSLRD